MQNSNPAEQEQSQANQRRGFRRLRPRKPRIVHNIKRLRQMGLIKRVKPPPKTTIPNAITMLNMFLGYSAIHATFEGNLITAVWIIYLATFTDLFDGRVAKLIGATSKFGAEFDSLSDLITFGVAPAFLIHTAFLQEYNLVGIAIAFFPLSFSAMRLARFNVQASKTAFFQGIPTPISAHLQVGLVGFAYAVWGEYRYPELAVLVALGTAFLMVSNIPFESNVIEKRSIGQMWKIAPFVLSIISVLIWGVEAIFPWAVFYVLLGLTRWIIFKGLRPAQSDDARIADGELHE